MDKETRVIEPLTTERGVVIRNLTPIEDSKYTRGYSYRFQALIDGAWYNCSGPCGDWSFIEHPSFSVKVGWWELDDIYYKRGRYAGEGETSG